MESREIAWKLLVVSHEADEGERRCNFSRALAGVKRH
jgi:hypothetical protein